MAVYLKVWYGFCRKSLFPVASTFTNTVCITAAKVSVTSARGKGDHRHYGEREEVYAFSIPEKLLEDFFADVQSLRKGGKA
jgi:hypothetical protein